MPGAEEHRPVSPIVERIQRDAGVPDLLEVLSGRLAGSDLQSLLLEVARRRSAERTPADLMGQRRRDRTLPPARVDGRRLHLMAGHALAAAEGFEAIALSPVSPAGLNAVLGGIDQNNALATVRGTEVLADPTTALALEAALRRRAGAGGVRLCAVDRVLRLQPFPEGWSQHFALLALVSAGRAEPNHGFELRALREHLRAAVRLLAAAGHPDPAIRVAGRETALSRVEREVFSPLRAEFPAARFALERGRSRGARYYDDLMLEVVIPSAGGGEQSIADGGTVDWTRRLLADRKERLLVSGIGMEQLAAGV